MLENKALPFVTNAKHTSNTLDLCDSNKDISVKCGIIRGKINGVTRIFHNIVPNVVYCTMLYGCGIQAKPEMYQAKHIHVLLNNCHFM